LPAHAIQLASAPLAHPGNPTHPASPFAVDETEAPTGSSAATVSSAAHTSASSGGVAPTGKPPYETGETPDFSKLRYRT